MVRGFAASAGLPTEYGERAHGPLRGVELHDGLEPLGRVRVHRYPVLLFEKSK